MWMRAPMQAGRPAALGRVELAMGPAGVVKNVGDDLQHMLGPLAHRHGYPPSSRPSVTNRSRTRFSGRLSLDRGSAAGGVSRFRG